MTVGEDLYTPVCCDQKYFHRLFYEVLPQAQSTVIFPNSDYSLAAMLNETIKNHRNYDIKMVMPNGIVNATTMVLHRWLGQTCYISESQPHAPWVKSLQVLLPLHQGEAFRSQSDLFHGMPRTSFSNTTLQEQIVLLTNSSGRGVDFIGKFEQEARVTGISSPSCVAVTTRVSDITEIQTLIRLNTR